MPIPTYNSDAARRLAERTDYEAWFLEAVYVIAEDELFPTFPDAVIYAADGTKPKFIGYMRGNIVLGDWRAGFLNAGAPLVFVATFKLLDMIMEWTLQENGLEPTFRFHQKLDQLDDSIRFPAVIESRSWLRERLIGLYRTLEPLRGTIIHNRHFASSDGAIRVSRSKRSVIGPSVEIASAELRRLALTVVSVLRYVDAAWPIDQYREKRLRHDLDSLALLHGCALLGQRQPFYPTVRVYSANPKTIDLRKIRSDLATQYVNNDCMFDLRIVLVNDGAVIDAFLFPWEVLESGGFHWSPAMLSETPRVPLPDDVSPEHCQALQGAT